MRPIRNGDYVMSIQNVVTPSNLGNEFDLGNLEANKVRVKIDPTLFRDTAGRLGVVNKFGKFRVVQNLAAGNNVISHNLALSNTSVIVDIRNDTTGAEVANRVVAEAANSTTIWVPAAITPARITIIG